jgi:NADH pyrophosphatase NudC (nudix superfamily)
VPSSDLALYHVLRMRRLLPDALLDERLRESTTRGVALEEILRVRKDLDATALAQALEVRARQGRRCGTCGETTYLTPNQTSAGTPCERCGKALLPKPGQSGSFKALRPPGPPPPR